MQASFRRAISSDLSAIQNIASNTVDKSYRYFLDDNAVTNYLQSGRLENYLSTNIKYIWLISNEYGVAGFAVCINNIIDFMLVDFEYQQKGLGKRLLQYCESLLFKKHQTIALESFEDNTNATEFYLANDWKVSGKYRDSNAKEIKFIFSKHHYTEEVR